VQDYVWNNLARPIGIQDIARAVNLSAYHLCHQFRATLAVSLWQYVRTCRVVYARRLIARHPDMSLTDIADASGFESYTAFYHAFRKTHGVKPSHRGRTAHL
jgi:AraC-like DNA-binding protein